MSTDYLPFGTQHKEVISVKYQCETEKYIVTYDPDMSLYCVAHKKYPLTCIKGLTLNEVIDFLQSTHIK